MDMYQKREMRKKAQEKNNEEKSKQTNINWFPGHMKKAKELIADNVKIVDVVIEVLDARLPISSKNPDIDKLIGNKPKLIVLNKTDLADDSETKKWKDYFAQSGKTALFLNSLKSVDKGIIVKKVKELIVDKLEREKKQGRKERAIRIMIVGIPNVGKSTFINQLVKKKITEVGNKPGVTKGKQWIRIDENLELLDMPGVLWPKFEDQTVAIKLASIGTINPEILDLYELSLILIDMLRKDKKYSDMIKTRYKVEYTDENTNLEIFDMIAKKRGFVVRGKEIDIKRTSITIMDELKNGKIGKISLDKVSN